MVVYAQLKKIVYGGRKIPLSRVMAHIIVMLTIRGRLITPFVLGSMSVGLNILIRHSFMDL